MRNLLHRLFFSTALAAVLAASWGSVALAEDKKTDKKAAGDKEKSDKEREAEKKRKEEEAKKRDEENWDKRKAGALGWPEPPDLGEMFEAAKKHPDAPVEQGTTEPKPGVGGYRKPPTDDEAEAADAAGGSFGEGAHEHDGGKDEKKDEKKDVKKDDKRDEKKDDKKEEHK